MMKKSKMPKTDYGMKDVVSMPRFGARAMRPGGMAKGGKVPMQEWEHSKKDLAQDKKLAAKRGVSMEKWEKSAADKKHDAQQSMKGLKKGGDIMAMKNTPMGRKMAAAAMGTKKMAAGGPTLAMLRDAMKPKTGAGPGVGPNSTQGSLQTMQGVSSGRTQGSLQAMQGMGSRPMQSSLQSRMNMASPNSGAFRPTSPSMARPNPAGKMAKGGGVEVKGKTKGKFI